MRVRSKSTLRLLVLLVAALLAFGAWPVYDAKVAWAGVLVGFKCYEAPPGSQHGQPLALDVTLSGATDIGGIDFPEEDVTVRSTKYFCRTTCVSQNGNGDACEASQFLKCYNITSAGPPVDTKNTLTVDTQLSQDEELKITSAQLLCVPARVRSDQ